MVSTAQKIRQKHATILSTAIATGQTKSEALAAAAGNTVLTTLITKTKDSDFCIKIPGKVVNVCLEDIVDLQNSNLPSNTVAGKLHDHLHMDLLPCIPVIQGDVEVLLKCKSYDTDIISCPGVVPVIPSGTIKYSDPSSEAKIGENC